MTKRLQIILDNVEKCNIFADIGCDHGYLTKGVLDLGKCEFAYFSDISKACLSKAEELLKDYVEKNMAKGVVSNGFEMLEEVDFALIAGMGGEEIISILKNARFLPRKLLLQPMKNVDKLRRFLIETGYGIKKDFCFLDVKFYDLILCEKGQDSLTEEEIIFGRDNIVSPLKPDFVARLKAEKETLISLLKKELPLDRKSEINYLLELIKKYV